MPGNLRQPVDHPPYLTRNEFIRFCGISLQTLRSYENAGIVQESTADAGIRCKFYAPEQRQAVEIAKAMRDSRLQMQNVGEKLTSDPDALLDDALEQKAGELRSDRRVLKSLSHLKARCGDYKRLHGYDGLYLRFIPQRWLALLPLPANKTDEGSRMPLAQAISELDAVIQIVGWAPAQSMGMLLDASASPHEANRFLFVELATPPLPAGSNADDPDSGCCFWARPDGSQPPCSREACATCERFGRMPREEERQLWARAWQENPALWDSTLMADELAAPYPDGAWAVCTCRAFGLPEPEGPVAASEPRLMPHETALPLGVTACELPAGVHLCRQFEAGRMEEALEEFSDVLDALGIAEEKDMENASGELPRGWSQAVGQDTLTHVKLPRHAALSAQREHCILIDDEPLPAQQDSIRMELQAWVVLDEYPSAEPSAQKEAPAVCPCRQR